MTNFKHIAKRQTQHLASMGDVEIDRRLDALAQAFGQAWLEQAGKHPLQMLWSRRDALATNELVLIGDAILSFGPTDSKWVSGQVKNVRDGDANTRAGAMFELLGLNLLRGPKSSVRPHPRNHPGYDAVVTVSDGAMLDVSLKSYGMSVHEREFLDQSARTEQAFLSELRKLNVTGLSLRAMARTYPSTSDWSALKLSLPGILSKVDCGRGPLHAVDNFWAVAICDVPDEVFPLSKKHLSYQVLMLAPFHQNEAKNLLDKLDAAAANARKHAPISNDIARAVLVRLPETISLTAIMRWASDYIANNPNGPLDLIMLYQPTVADTTAGSSVIDHGVILCPVQSFSAWARPSRQITLNIPVGICTGKPTQRQLMGASNLPSIDQMYSFQRGEFFSMFNQNPTGTGTANLNNFASGIVRHAVMAMNDGQEITLGGIFPPEKTLSLFL